LPRGHRHADSFANFLLLNLKTPSRRTPTRAEANGIFLRPQSGAGLPHCLRMTIGPPDHVDLAVTALEDWAGGSMTRMRPSRGRARIGVLVPFTNTNLEPDIALMAPPGVSLHFARMGGYDEDEIPDETQMQGLGAADLQETLTLLSGAKPDVVLYGCTSATLSHGPAFDRDLAAAIKAQSGAQTVTAAGALVHALRTLARPRRSPSPRPMCRRSTTSPSRSWPRWGSRPSPAPISSARRSATRVRAR
jgi:hypothetical protein